MLGSFGYCVYRNRCIGTEGLAGYEEMQYVPVALVQRLRQHTAHKVRLVRLH